MSVGSSLRIARERRRITLADIAQHTNIKLELLIDLENNDLSRWPKQRVYRHGYLHAYARALGLDPAAVLARFDDEFGDPHPVAFHGRPRKPARAMPFAFMRHAVLLASVAILIGAVVQMPERRSTAVAVSQPVAVAPPIPANETAAPESLESPLATPAGVVADAAAPQIVEEVPQIAEFDEEFQIEGELRITSRPARAHVTVNGIGRGSTPLRVRYLPLGSYTVRVIHPGYKIRETRVTLRPEQPTRTVRVVLRDAPAYVMSATLDARDSRLH